MDDKSRYHHGDLRKALLNAGLDILEDEGLAALSLRAVAARAGVSHAAPAHHFGNLRGLLTALVAIAFARFAAAMAAERAQAAADPAEQIRAAGRGYVAFAQRNPALFRLMFSSASLDAGDADLRRAGESAYRHLIEIAEPAAEALGAATEIGRREIAQFIWATIHGYAHLLVDGRLLGADLAEPDPPPDIGGLLFGLKFGAASQAAAPAHSAPDVSPDS